MSNVFSNNYQNFSYWFSTTTLDNNNNVVSDINKGIENMIVGLSDDLTSKNNHERFIIPETQNGMPDIVANGKYNNENMWWYLCFSNSLDDPFTQYKTEILYYAFDEAILSNHNNRKNETKNTKKSKIGTIIELN